MTRGESTTVFGVRTNLLALVCCAMLLSCSGWLAQAQEAADDDCIYSPSNVSCTNYTMPSAMVQQGINGNCKMMPNMVGCTVERICTAPDASRAVTRSPYCAEFSVLKNLCVDMPGMSPCKNYTSMCSNVSVVAECRARSLPAPKSMALSNIVEKMCNDMYMEPCGKCKKQGMMLQCDLLQVYSDLCLSMWMEGCEDWENMCKVIPDWPLCAASPGEEVPVMRMYFHNSLLDYVLFKEWVPRNWWQYTLTIIAIIVLGMFYELLKVLRSIWEGYMSKRKEAEILGDDQHGMHNGLSDSDLGHEHRHRSRSGSVWNFIKGWDWKVEIPRACMAFVETLIGLVLMLVAMTFNVGLFLAVCAGAFFGSLIFGRFANFTHMKQGCH
jgi:copper transporter 1